MSNTSIEEFRRQAREWIEANLERRNSAQGTHKPRGIDHKTVDGIREQRAIQRKIFEGGYAGISYPVEYGGRGLTIDHERAFNEEAAPFATPDFGVAGGTTFSVCARTMLAHASPEFLLKHIPPILAGDELWVQFFSEPEAGSDLAGIRTRATRDGDHWVINGAKIWSSGAYYADYGMCLARTNWDVPKHRGLTWFAVPTSAKGVTVQPITEINGDAEFCQEFLDDVELTDSDVIGEVNQGWRVAQTMLVFERGGGDAAPASGRSREIAPDLVRLARRVGRDQDSNVRQLIARAQINDFAMECLSDRIAARLKASNGMDSGVAAYLKLAVGTLGPIRARIGLQVGGAHALLWEDKDVGGMTPAVNFLNGRLMSIAGGTNEMQRNGIGERVLGLPREPSFDTTKPFSDVLRDSRDWSGKVG